MKKTALILWIVAALFLVSSVPLFTEGNITAGVCGIAIAAVLFFIGYRKGAASKEQSGQSDTNENAQSEQTKPAAPPSRKGTYHVYIEKGGKKYHRDKKCSGMKKPEYVPLEHALQKGYTECKKCRYH